MEHVFSLSGLTVMPWWGLMVFAPGWRWTRRLLVSPLVLLAPALLYAALVLPAIATIFPAVARPELAGIAALLGSPNGATIAWVHFLAFDLFVGRWIYLDARARGLAWWLTSPLLFLTLMLGPLGLVSYLALRAVDVKAAVAAVRGLLKTAAQGSRALTTVGWMSAVVLIASLILQLVDSRHVLGASTWIKPAKFGASVFLNAIALGWVFAHLRSANPAIAAKGLRRSATIIAAMLGFELALIVLQAARGVPSHFNNATAFDVLVFRLMAFGITVMWLAQAYVTWRAFRQPMVGSSSVPSTPAVTWGIRLGLLAAVLGGGLGFIMPIPTAAQRDSLSTGKTPTALGSHAVGVADGGPGLPVTHWSTTGGDLRVPHFIGLHGLQVLPLVAWGITRRSRRRLRQNESLVPLDTRSLDDNQEGVRNGRLLLVAGATYLGIMLITLIQALRAQPLLAPDSVTLFMFGGLGLASVAAWLSFEVDAGSPPVFRPFEEEGVAS